ncbi:MAG: menaquinone biosynthesis decarboxylase [Bacteroidales bacterium]|jgi:4-hydroxy-3-polyprenylbenzoate decarboxylase|nr:menaquinone biosynthesis decarboxylase [Bacteroidales bacterium]
MPYKSLQEYISALRQQGELIEIHEKVNTALEITEIADRFSKQDAAHNKALLFTNTGTQFPVFINGFGSERRMAMALSATDLDEPRRRIEALFLQLTSPKESLWDKLKMLPLLTELNTWMPKKIRSKAACQQCVQHNPDLSELPILTCWQHDGGKFITLPMVITQHPTLGTRNVGMYRMQVIDATSTAMHWHTHKTGANHYEAYKALGRKMPIAVALGGDPAHTFSATAPLPENIDEYMLSGFLRQQHVELVKCVTNDLYVPADADFIIEGYVDPAEEKFLEGPFGDHTGFYSLPDYYPVFHVTCITHKKNAVYPATIVGIPPMEDAWIGKATERIFLAPIRLLMVPEMIDYRMPFEGVAHNLVIVKIRKTFAGQAFKVMNTLWGAGQMMFNKCLIVVDEHCDIENPQEILHALMRNCSIATDILITKGPLDVLDHAAPQVGFGSKIGFDATDKMIEKQEPLSQNYTLVAHDITTSVTDICQQKPMANFTLIHDRAIENTDFATIVWHVLNNIDPQNDCSIIDNSHILIDGRTKIQGMAPRDWPTPVVSSLETIQAVDELWNKAFSIPCLASPSRNYQKLVYSNSAWFVKQRE